MKKFLSVLLAAVCFFIVSCKNAAFNDFGTLIIKLPGGGVSERGAGEFAEIDYSVLVYKFSIKASDGITEDVELTGNSEPLKKEVRSGNCDINLQVFTPNAEVPMYEGSTSVYVIPGENNKANIKVSKIDYTKTVPVGINLRMKGNRVYCSNIDTNLTNLEVQRVYIDGSTDKDFITATELYEVSFIKKPETKTSIGFYPVKLKAKDASSFEKTLYLPVYYSVFNGRVKENEEKYSLEITSETKTIGGSNSTFTANVSDFSLIYNSKSGVETEIEAIPEITDISWFVNGEVVEKETETVYEFKPTEIGDYEIYCKASVSVPDDTTTECIVNEWLVDTTTESNKIEKEITKIKGDKVELGEGSGATFEGEIAHTETFLTQETEENADAMYFYIIYENGSKTADSTLYTCYWKINGEKLEAPATINYPEIENFGFYDNYIGKNIYVISKMMIDKTTLEPGVYEITCVVKTPDRYWQDFSCMLVIE